MVLVCVSVGLSLSLIGAGLCQCRSLSLCYHVISVGLSLSLSLLSVCVSGNRHYQLLFFLYPTDFGLFLSVSVLLERTSESVAADGATGQ